MYIIFSVHYSARLHVFKWILSLTDVLICLAAWLNSHCWHTKLNMYRTSRLLIAPLCILSGQHIVALSKHIIPWITFIYGSHIILLFTWRYVYWFWGGYNYNGSPAWIITYWLMGECYWNNMAATNSSVSLETNFLVIFCNVKLSDFGLNGILFTVWKILNMFHVSWFLPGSVGVILQKSLHLSWIRFLPHYCVGVT